MCKFISHFLLTQGGQDPNPFYFVITSCWTAQLALKFVIFHPQSCKYIGLQVYYCLYLLSLAKNEIPFAAQSVPGFVFDSSISRRKIINFLFEN